MQKYTAYLKSVNQDAIAAAAQFAKLDNDKSASLSSAEFLKGAHKGSAAKSN